MNCYLINARKTPRNHHYRFKWATTFFRYSFLLSLIHSLSRECAYTRFFSLFPRKSFFRASVYLFSFFSLFYLEMEPSERTPLCKAIFNPFWRPFSPSFFESFVSHPALLTPVVSISILLLHPFPTLSHSLSLPLLTVFSNPVSPKLCRILVRR